MKHLSLFVIGLYSLTMTGCIDEDRKRGQDNESARAQMADAGAANELADSGLAQDDPPRPPTLVDSMQPESGGQGSDPADVMEPSTQPPTPMGDECIGDDDCDVPQLQTCRGGLCLDRCGMGIDCLRGGECVDGACIKECEGNDQCAEGSECIDFKCVELTPCETGEECTNDERCEDGFCRSLPPCVGDRTCGENEVCSQGRCRESTECAQRDDCGDTLDCIGGRCVPFVCRGDTDCPDDEVCRAGTCEEPGAPVVSAVRILTRGRSIRVGQTLQLTAIALDANDNIVATEGFRWSSTNTDIASIDVMSGLLTGGPSTGVSNITATYINPDNSTVTSDPFVTVRVIPAEVPEVLTVRVVSRATGSPIAGATVINGEQSQVTADDGVARFMTAMPSTVTVVSAIHNAVTIVGAPPTEIVVPVDERRTMGEIAGYTGEVDFRNVTTEGGVELSLSGASFGAGLAQLSIETLIGDIFSRSFGFGNFGFDLPLPGGITLKAELPFIGETTLKTKVYAIAEAGLRLGWSFAGRIDAQELIALARGGDVDIGQILAQLFPYFETFEHGLIVAENLEAFPRRPDEADIDGDEDRDELIPDYNAFPVYNSAPSQPQQLRMSINPTNSLSDGETAIYFSGVELEEVGFVPLGVTAASEPDLIVPSRLAAPYGGLEGGRPVIVNLSAEFGGQRQIPTDITIRVQRFENRVPADITWPQRSANLGRPSTPEYDVMARRFQGSDVDAADFHRGVLTSPGGKWTIYFNPGTASSTQLPALPEGMDDLGQNIFRVEHEAIQLTENLSFESLLQQTDAQTIADLDSVFTALSRSVSQ